MKESNIEETNQTIKKKMFFEKETSQCYTIGQFFQLIVKREVRKLAPNDQNTIHRL